MTSNRQGRGKNSVSNQPGALRDTVVAAGVFDDISVSESRNGWRKHKSLPISWGLTAKEDAQSQGTDKSNANESPKEENNQLTVRFAERQKRNLMSSVRQPSSPVKETQRSSRQIRVD